MFIATDSKIERGFGNKRHQIRLKIKESILCVENYLLVTFIP